MEANQSILHAAERGKKWAAREVELAPRLTNIFYYQAYNDLRTMAQTPMGEILIPLDKIAWEAERLGMDLLEREAFEFIMRRVDVAMLNQKNKKPGK